MDEEIRANELVVRYFNNIEAEIESKIGEVINKTKSSHDPVFVWNDREFAGLIWPYKVLFMQKPDMNTKLRSLVTMPPFLTPDTNIYKVVEQMISLRLYTLPIFNDHKEILGIIKATDIIKKIPINGVLKEELLIFSDKETVREIYSLMRQKKQTRAVVTDKDGKLAGIIGRRDILTAMFRPAENKQRYASKGGQNNAGEFDINWETKLDYPLANIMRTDVVWSDSVNPADWLKKILNSATTSVVLVDNLKKPIGIVSIQAFLQAIMVDKPTGGALIELVDKKNILTPSRREGVEKMMRILGKKVERINKLKRIKLVIDGTGSVKGKVNVYKTALETETENKDIKRASGENRDLKAAIQETFEELAEQLRRQKDKKNPKEVRFR